MAILRKNPFEEGPTPNVKFGAKYTELIGSEEAFKAWVKNPFAEVYHLETGEIATKDTPFAHGVWAIDNHFVL